MRFTKGVRIESKKKGTELQIPNHISDIVQLESRKLALATFNGLFLLNDDTAAEGASERAADHHLKGQRVRCLSALSGHILIIGLASRRQLIIYDTSSRSTLLTIESPTLLGNASLSFYSIKPLAIASSIGYFVIKDSRGIWLLKASVLPSGVLGGTALITKAQVSDGSSDSLVIDSDSLWTLASTNVKRWAHREYYDRRTVIEISLM